MSGREKAREVHGKARNEKARPEDYAWSCIITKTLTMHLEHSRASEAKVPAVMHGTAF